MFPEALIVTVNSIESIVLAIATFEPDTYPSRMSRAEKHRLTHRGGFVRSMLAAPDCRHGSAAPRLEDLWSPDSQPAVGIPTVRLLHEARSTGSPGSRASTLPSTRSPSLDMTPTP